MIKSPSTILHMKHMFVLREARAAPVDDDKKRGIERASHH